MEWKSILGRTNILWWQWGERKQKWRFRKKEGRFISKWERKGDSQEHSWRQHGSWWEGDFYHKGTVELVKCKKSLCKKHLCTRLAEELKELVKAAKKRLGKEKGRKPHWKSLFYRTIKNMRKEKHCPIKHIKDKAVSNSCVHRMCSLTLVDIPLSLSYIPKRPQLQVIWYTPGV